MYKCILISDSPVKGGGFGEEEKIVGSRYRVWIVQFSEDPSERPLAENQDLVALEPAESHVMTARQARDYVEAFNRAAAHESRTIRAAAFPVTVHYTGEPKPGEAIASRRMNFFPQAHKKSPPAACQESAGNGLPPREST